MRENKGLTLVELIIVMACISGVTLFFWTILNSASEDSYTINDKIEVQTGVTSLMNAIQQDIQEAKIYNISATERHIISVEEEELPDNKKIYTYSFAAGEFSYVFNESTRSVVRNQNGTSSTYYNIENFSITPIKKEKYGAEVSILGKKINDEANKSRYQLNSTFYTRNTL